MPLRAVFLDSSPLGLITKRLYHSQEAMACAEWARNLNASGVSIYVPEIADYEVRRELVRAKNMAAVARLDLFNRHVADRYLSLNTQAMRRAADLWASLRNSGIPTASPEAIDGDVILAAQVLNFCDEQGVTPGDIRVASANVRHLSRMVNAEPWAQIMPLTVPENEAA